MRPNLALFHPLVVICEIVVYMNYGVVVVKVFFSMHMSKAVPILELQLLCDSTISVLSTQYCMFNPTVITSHQLYFEDTHYQMYWEVCVLIDEARL